MELNENTEMLATEQILIDCDSENGNVSGYITNAPGIHIANYLADFTERSPEIAAFLKAHFTRVALLQNMNVEEDARGQGEGNELMNQCFDIIGYAGCDAILLIADTAEEQAEGFNLVTWYEGFDFETVLQTNAGPLMVYPPETADALRGVLLPG